MSKTPPGLRRSARRRAASDGSSKWWKPRPTTAMSKPERSGSARDGDGVADSRLPWTARISSEVRPW